MSTTTPRPSLIAAAVAGSLAAAGALAVSELAAGTTGGRSLVVAVGDWVINHAPHALIAFGKRNFGTNDKPALVAGIIVLSIIFGALLGVASRRHLAVGVAGIGAFGVAGMLAALADPLHSAASAVFAAAVAVVAGAGVLRMLLAVRPAPHGQTEAVSGEDRRAFLRLAALTTAGVAVSALLGRRLLERGHNAVSAARNRLGLPPARQPVAPPTAAMTVGVERVTPLVTANNDFYRIDTALSYPRIDYESWRLRIHGMVHTPIEVSFDDLTAMELIERYVTIGCVSNEVGGALVSTASWRGVRLRDVLSRAGVASDADQVVGRSVDGFTVGFPTVAALDDRDAMVAVGMNGVPLPLAPRVPGSAHRSRSLRVRVGNQMADRYRAHAL